MSLRTYHAVVGILALVVGCGHASSGAGGHGGHGGESGTASGGGSAARGSATGAGGGAMSGPTGSGGACQPSTGSSLSCPSTPGRGPFCSAEECYGPDDQNCDVGCPTRKSANCMGRCSDNHDALAVCTEGVWTCSIGGKQVGTCCTDDCLSPNCCFPVACREGMGTTVGVGVGVGSGAGGSGGGGGGSGGSNGSGDCHGTSMCNGHTFKASCDAKGNCSCSLDGKAVGTCVNQPAAGGCDPTGGCCGAYFEGC